MGTTFKKKKLIFINNKNSNKNEQKTGTNKIKKVSKRWPVIFFMFLFLSVPIFSKKKKKDQKSFQTLAGHLFYVPFPVCPNLFKKKRKKRKKENKKKQKKKTRPNKRKQCKRRPIGNIYLFCFSPFFHFYNLFYFDSTGMENLQYTEKTKLNEEVLCSLMMYDLIHELKFCISLSLFLFFEK